MDRKQHSFEPSKGAIYTLGLSGTKKQKHPPLLVAGNGSDITNQQVVHGRAKRKLITQTLVLSLIDVAIEKGDREQEQSYWNTYHCQEKVISSVGRLYGQYCKNRYCTLCCSIRKAEIINKYLPVIKTWDDTYFVTLTIKACSKRLLQSRIDGITKAFQRIKDKCKKRNQRGKAPKLIGVKSIECNFNPHKRTYNPHLHLIVASKEIAEILIKEWLLIWTSKFTSKKAQFARPVIDTERDLIEIIKYGSKIFTEPDINQKTNKKTNRNIYVAALDTIFCTLKKHRIFDRFGFNLPKDHQQEPKKVTALADYREWTYNIQKADWECTKDNKVLTGFVPEYNLDLLLQQHIDTAIS